MQYLQKLGIIFVIMTQLKNGMCLILQHMLIKLFL